MYKSKDIMRRTNKICFSKTVLFLISPIFLSCFFLACKSDSEDKEDQKPEVFAVGSTSFNADDSIPYKYTCLNSAQVFPQLNWNGVKTDVKSFAIIMDDPDAIGVVGYIWNHWVLYDIPGDVRSISEGTSKLGPLPVGTKRGLSSFGDTSYGGPCPPPSQLHHYKFRIFALNVSSCGLSSGANAAQLRQAMSGKISDSAIYTGTFKR